MSKAWLLLAVVPLGSCNKPIRCDAHGMIIVPDDASNEERLDLTQRNIDFVSRRADAAIGRGGHYTTQSLDKATGCP